MAKQTKATQKLRKATKEVAGRTVRAIAGALRREIKYVNGAADQSKPRTAPSNRRGCRTNSPRHRRRFAP